MIHKLCTLDGDVQALNRLLELLKEVPTSVNARRAAQQLIANQPSLDA